MPTSCLLRPFRSILSSPVFSRVGRLRYTVYVRSPRPSSGAQGREGTGPAGSTVNGDFQLGSCQPLNKRPALRTRTSFCSAVNRAAVAPRRFLTVSLSRLGWDGGPSFDTESVQQIKMPDGSTVAIRPQLSGRRDFDRPAQLGLPTHTSSLPYDICEVIRFPDFRGHL